MALIQTKELLLNAQKNGYAIGAFNVANMEMVIGTIKAAEELNSPVILQIAEGRLKHSPLKLIGPLMVSAAKSAKVPVAVHLDHGTTLNTIVEALNLGFTSVMIDGSGLELDKNIEITKRVVQLSQNFGANVEAEIGVVGGSEDDSEELKSRYTSAKEAVKFSNLTEVDALAVAIGNAHGIYKSAPNLSIETLKKINSSVKTPLVLHGGSGLSKKDFKTCIQNGIHKINVATATFNSVAQNITKYVPQEALDYFEVHNLEIEGAYLSVKKHINIFGSKEMSKKFI